MKIFDEMLQNALENFAIFLHFIYIHKSLNVFRSPENN